MSKYTRDESDVKEFDNDDRANYERFLLDYNVDANAEASNGIATTKALWNFTLKGTPMSELKNVTSLYSVSYSVMVAIATFFVGIICILLVIFILLYIFSLGAYSAGDIQVYGSVLFVVLLIVILINIFVKLKDDVQNNLEKIVYKL